MNKICVVGCGYWGKNHISTLNKLGYLGAVVDTDQSQLSKFSDKYANIKIFTSLNNALQDKNLNAFVVASPSATHYPLAREIIKSGKHVLVEKPLALSSKDAHKLIDLAKKNRVNLMVGHVLLFHPAILKMKELIEKNKIGRLQYIYSNRLNLGKVRNNENVFGRPMGFQRFCTRSFESF